MDLERNTGLGANGAWARRVARIVRPKSVVEGAGVRLKRSIATPELDHIDPFLLFDQFGSDNPDDYLAGFPMHPHRGIETVTYMLAGALRHRDSIGNAGVIEAGDVQWMTSGGGILHEEMPESRDGKMEGFQLWVNLPARLKMSQPRYQEILAGRIPEVRRPDGTRIKIIAGAVDGVAGPVTEVAIKPTYLDIAVPANQTLVLSTERGHSVFAYVFEGSGWFGDETPRSDEPIDSFSLVVLSDGDYVVAHASERGLRFMLASGQPLNEPIARYGPFVMNTRAEIEQALRDLRNGTFVYRQRGV